MKKLSISAISAFTILLASCGNSADTNSSASSESQPAESTISSAVCKFDYSAATTKVTFTAFKTMAKVAVGGAFDAFEILGTTSSNSESAVFSDATFNIVASSVNTQNTGRDQKIHKYVFTPLMPNDTISGGVRKIGEAVNGKGPAIIYITMNGITKDINATFTVSGTELILNASIDLANWDGSDAVDVLNKECELLHTGDDGVSKLWSNVDIQILTNLAKECN